MTPESSKDQGIQFEPPSRIAAPPGKIFDLVSISGITRIKMIGDLKHEIEILPFTVDEKSREQAVVILQKRLDDYIPDRLTELGTKDVTVEQISANAGAFANIYPVRKAIRALLEYERLEGDSRRVWEEMREYLLGRGITPSVHMGTPHPGVSRVLDDLRTVLVSEQERRERLAKKNRSRRP